MNSQAQPFFGKGTYGPVPDMNRMFVWEATQMLMEGFMAHQNDLPRLLEIAQHLTNILETTRAQYNGALADRDMVYRKLQETDNKLLQIENVVRRYCTVREPVVASDGFTYDRPAITQYLQDCARTNSKAYSQQTKEELTDVLVPNESLRRLVDTLKGIRTTEVPQLVPRNPITNTSGAARMNAWSDESPSMTLNPVGTVDPSVRTAAESATASVPSANNLSSVNPPAPVNNGAGSGVGVAIPAPAGARRFEMGNANGGKGGKYGGGQKPALHPCLRVYGFCNFMDDCTFAHYPFEACLNHIKGKCRFGQNCKELHVDPRDPRYQNRNSYAATHGHQKPQQQSLPQHDNAAVKKGTAVSNNKAAESQPADKTAASASSESGSKAGTPPTVSAETKDTTTKTETGSKPAATAEA